MSERGKIPFHTTWLQRFKLIKIVMVMVFAGLNLKFIWQAAKIASFDQGTFDLMEMWLVDHVQRSELMQDIKTSINDWS